MIQFSKGKYMSSSLLAGFICFSATAFAQPLSGNYTIDGGQVTAGTNFASFNDAVNALSANGISSAVNFQVAPGAYNEQVIIPEITGASAIATITFNGNESDIVFNATDPNERAVVKLKGADYVHLRNLGIIATGSLSGEFGYGVQLISGADYNAIVNCKISVAQVMASTPVTNYAGIVLNSTPDFIVTPGDAQCNYNIIDSNKVSGGYHGISLVADGSNFMIQGNKVRYNTVLDFYNAGIYLNGNDGAIIENNDISRPNRATSALFYGIQLYNISRKVMITGNKIHDPFGGTPAYVTSGANGIYLVDAAAVPGEENIIANNIIYNLKCNSVVRAIWLGNTTSTSIGSSYNKIINNTISLDDEAFAGFASTTGIETSLSAQNLTIQNNIISIKRVGSSFTTRTGLFMPSTNNVVDHNNIFIAPGSTMFIAKWASANCITMADWQSNTGDASSIAEDPQFTNILAGDLLPSNNALQVGMDISTTGIATDITGLGRNNIPTLGAFEINGVVLPVLMSPLKARLNTENKALLSWNTYSETNNAGFNIQRSEDGVSWVTIGFQRTNAINGNSQTMLDYTFTDDYKVEHKLFYRLEQKDMDGKTVYSNVVAVNAVKSLPNQGFIVYPNPAVDVIHFGFGEGSAAKGTVCIIDFMGKVMLTKEISIGDNDLNIASLPAGKYVVKLIEGSNVFTTTFIRLK